MADLRLEVFHHLFAAAAEEMGVALERAAFSPNVRERRDFSCALFDGAGRMLAQAAHLPVHLGSLPACVEAVLAGCTLAPGDAVVLNDPYAGGTHLPDVTLVSPVFLAGARRRGARARPDFLVANRAHHADVGGARPGSMAPAADVHGEGLRLPPVHLVRGGALEHDLLRVFLANVRAPAEREGDLLAQWSANRLGARRLEEMAAEHGAAELARRAQALLAWTERLTRAFLRTLPAREARFADELEVDGVRGVRLAVRLAVHHGRRGAERLVADLRECDAQREAPINCPRAVALSALFYVTRLFLPDGTPTNAGVLRPLELLTRPGSVVDARYPAPVAAGNVETSQRLVDLLLGALARLCPSRVPAASAGTMSNLAFGGREGAGGARAFAYYETSPGGAGASPERAGASALQTHMTNTRNTPVEALERLYPVRVVALGLRRGSGGAGARRGGDGLVKRLRFLAPVSLSWIAERQARGPWGLAGGAPGAPGGARVRLPGARAWTRLAPQAALDLPAGAELELATPGGGGHGRLAGAPRGSRAPLPAKAQRSGARRGR